MSDECEEKELYDLVKKQFHYDDHTVVSGDESIHSMSEERLKEEHDGGIYLELKKQYEDAA